MREASLRIWRLAISVLRACWELAQRESQVLCDKCHGNPQIAGLVICPLGENTEEIRTLYNDG